MPWWPFSLGGASMGDTSSPALSPPKSNPSSAPTAAPSSPTTTTKHVQGPGGATDPDAPEGAEAQTALASWAALLEPFSAGGGALPEKARTDVRQKLARPNAHLWEYVPFFAKQGTSLTKAFVQHHIYGPPKPSWGVELTLFTTFLREVSTYSHLSSLARLRSALELSSLLPTPKDGIVTPISFKVKRRNLRGLLADSDAQETGSREIAGEWVTNKRLWRRMTREWTLDKPAEAGAGASAGAGGAQKGTGSAGGGNKDGLVCLYLHGGAYYMFSAETHRYLTISVSRYCDARVFAINYRLAPETRFPGQLHDAVSAYMRLTVDLKIPPENIIIAGDSAGGGLALATLMYLRDEGYPLPSGGVLMSPWVDLTMSCESWTTNRPYDYLPTPNDEDDHMHPVKCLLGDQIDKYLTHPYVSPLFGKFEGLPPLLIQAGDAEVLRDEITLLAHKAAIAGVKVEHEIFEDCVHVFQAFLFLEASRKAFQSQRSFVKHTLPRLKRKAAERAAAASSTSASSAPGSASTAAATSNAPSPDERDESSATGDSASSGFDFAEVDRSIAADAHEVDQQGNADKKSLRSPPSAGGLDLPSGSSEEDDVDGLDDEMDEDDDDALGVTDVDMTTDSSDAAASPVLRGKRRAVHSPADERATPPTADALVHVRAPPSPDPSSSTLFAAPSTSTSSSSSSATATRTSTSSSASASASPTALASPSLVDAHPSVRPILRAYASARDLSMSTLRKTHSLSSPSAVGRRLSLAPAPSSSATASAAPPTPSSSPRKRRSATVTSPRSPALAMPGGGGGLSAPTTPLALSPRPLDQRRELHARSSSHPDVAELLRSYMDELEAGEAPRAKTRVWTAAAAGGRSSRAASEVDEVE
ncbi:hypothetical protein JCM3775_003121 [Rhodotorula graminis]